MGARLVHPCSSAWPALRDSTLTGTPRPSPTGTIESVFEYPAPPTLFPVNRPVLVNMQAALPGVGRRMDGVPMWCRSSGLRVEPYMQGQQIAWVRRFDGGWFRRR